MPTVQQQREKLVELLEHLFQLNQPDLDFGFYRIMHAKAKEVTRFLKDDLLQIVQDAFGQHNEARITELREAYEKEVETAKQYGAPNPEDTPRVKEAKERLEAATDTSKVEGEVYDHLYRFFERYYDNGDFISLRYLTRETRGKAAPYAVPYNGEEVKLHWANVDQYYIKTTEYFTNFTFDLTKAREVQEAHGALFREKELKPLRVHFRIVAASEGEHGNIKTATGQKRYFLIHAADPVNLENGELVARFEYRPDPEKTGQDSIWQAKRNEESVAAILNALKTLDGAKEHLTLLQVPAPTDKQKDRTLLAKYITRYTCRNTMDYFIHKDLGNFLRRELDFYIKNEVMRLDDIESAAAPKVEQYLGKIRVLRTLAGKLIDFLAQLENFQKKLWLKKKFVVETNYCITLDRILAIEDETTRDWMIQQIIINDTQREEWIRLFAIDEIKGDLMTPSYSKPLAVEFLKANPYLVLDTQFFGQEFKDRLLASFNDLDEQTDGLLVHSENFQAIMLLHNRYLGQVQSIYIDPPYNTSASEIIYKNSYKHASWLSLVENRLRASGQLLTADGILCITIDDSEFHRLRGFIETVFGEECVLGVAAIRSNPSGRSTAKGFSIAHEYALFVSGSDVATIGRLQRTQEQIARYGETDEIGAFEWVNFRKHGGANANRSARPRLFYPIFASGGEVRIPQMEWNFEDKSWRLLELPTDGEEVIYPVNAQGEEKTWKWGHETAQANILDLCARPDQTGKTGIYCKSRINEAGTLPLTWWDKKQYSATEYGTNLLADILGESNRFSFPKSVYATADSLKVANLCDSDTALDFFAGSGTTGHAVINLNREDSWNRKYILVEMGEYFASVLKPRIQKVIYSKDWRDGKPVSREGISHLFKYIRLESYEDCLSNLTLSDDPIRAKLLERNAGLREDYMLHYMLDVETRGSQSLLNIDHFADPTAYTLKVRKSGSDEYEWKHVDLLETFNYLIGLRVEHIATPHTFTAHFTRKPDPELPKDTHTRLVLHGRLKQDPNGPWWFRKVEGSVQNGNGVKEKVLIVWRKLTGDLEQDNLMLNEWFKANCISTRDSKFDTIYVNGSNNLPNLKQEGDRWEVRLIEEDFHRLMWDVEDV